MAGIVGTVCAITGAEHAIPLFDNTGGTGIGRLITGYDRIHKSITGYIDRVEYSR